MPEGAEEGILKGIYLLRKGETAKPKAKAQLLVRATAPQINAMNTENPLADLLAMAQPESVDTQIEVLRSQPFIDEVLRAAGEADQFASVLGEHGTAEELRRRMQLKTLLFGMGETFRVLLQKKIEAGNVAAEGD